MFGNKSKKTSPLQKEDIFFPYRLCHLYISEKYKHIMFVPYGNNGGGAYSELENIISDRWPCDFEKLQLNIEETLNRALSPAKYVKGNWPSYQNSKATSQQSFKTDYIQIRLDTDNSRPYGDGEVERINISAQPSPLENTYWLKSCYHLLKTDVAQVVLDIFDACMKIRS